MKPILLTLSSHTKGLPRFNESIKNLGEVEHIAVQFLPYSSEFTNCIYTGVPFPGHVKKQMFIPKGLDPERYVIFSDTDDVIFQRPFPEFTHDLYLAPENVPHRETIWKYQIEKYPVFSPLVDQDVFNCGTYAMKVKTMYEMIDFLFSFKCGDYLNLGFEQMHFNMFLYQRKDLSRVIDLGIFTPLFRNLNDGWISKDETWKYKGKDISCVHSNGVKLL